LPSRQCELYAVVWCGPIIYLKSVSIIRKRCRWCPCVGSSGQSTTNCEDGLQVGCGPVFQEESDGASSTGPGKGDRIVSSNVGEFGSGVCELSSLSNGKYRSGEESTREMHFARLKCLRGQVGRSWSMYVVVLESAMY